MKVGDNIFIYVEYPRVGEPNILEDTITKIGRKYIYLRSKERIDIEEMMIENYKGRAYCKAFLSHGEAYDQILKRDIVYYIGSASLMSCSLEDLQKIKDIIDKYQNQL